MLANFNSNYKFFNRLKFSYIFLKLVYYAYYNIILKLLV
jgi:hypothetical protein